MPHAAQPRPCASCFGPRIGVVSERFADDRTAFERHSQLVHAGQAPSLCMRRDGSRYVCHCKHNHG